MNNEKILVPKKCSVAPKVRYVLKWHCCPKCGARIFLLEQQQLYAMKCDWKTTEFPYISFSQEGGGGMNGQTIDSGVLLDFLEGRLKAIDGNHRRREARREYCEGSGRA